MLSRDLRHALAADKLNIAIGIAPAGEDVYLVNSATIRPIWAMADGFRWEKHLPLPIVRHPDPCEYAERMRVGLFYKHARLSKAGHGLAQWLMEQIGAAGQGLGS